MVGSEYNGEEQGPCHEESKKFQLEFKRQAVEELVSRESGLAQLRRRYDVTSSLLYHWKRQYSRGKFDNEPREEEAGRTASAGPRETADHQGMEMPWCRHPVGVPGDEAFKKQLL